MEDHLTHLHTSVLAAILVLQHDARSLDARVEEAEAVLCAALLCWDMRACIDATLSPGTLNVTNSGESLATTSAPVNRPDPAPLPLSAYRQERGLTISAFTEMLGIFHHEYVAVIHRQPVDPRVRDQIAFKLGVPWQAIAEFMPKPPPQLKPRPVAIPPGEGAEVPSTPWYLVDEQTGQVLSGPHTEPLPENAVYLHDPFKGEEWNLVVLCDYSHLTEEDCLPPGGYSRNERDAVYDNEYALEDDSAIDSRPDLDELVHVYGRAQAL